jgi:hypothetical protein
MGVDVRRSLPDWFADRIADWVPDWPPDALTRAFWAARPHWRRGLLMGSGLLLALLGTIQFLVVGDPLVAASPGVSWAAASGKAGAVALAAGVPAGGAQKLADYRSLFAPPGQDTPPAYSHSWYIDDLGQSAMQRLGRADAVRQSAGCTTSFVILDFGQPGMDDDGTYGTYDFAPTSPFVSDAQIERAVESYADGWHAAAAACDQLLVGPGTSNYHECVFGADCSIFEAGQQWAVTANRIQVYLRTQRWTDHMNAFAADDMETGWDSAARTRQFVDGYTAGDVGGLYLLDFGDAWKSPTWTDADVYYVAWQAGYDLPFPEVYFEGAANRWAAVKGEFMHGAAGPMVMAGVMAECQQVDPLPGDICANPDDGEFGTVQAWQHLWDTMGAASVGQPSMAFISDIRYQARFGT